MKKLALGNPNGPNDTRWVHLSLKLIERASHEDIETIFDEYAISGAYTELRALDNGAQSLGDVYNFLSTMVTDIHKRGSKRNPNEV